MQKKARNIAVSKNASDTGDAAEASAVTEMTKDVPITLAPVSNDNSRAEQKSRAARPKVNRQPRKEGHAAAPVSAKKKPHAAARRDVPLHTAGASANEDSGMSASESAQTETAETGRIDSGAPSTMYFDIRFALGLIALVVFVNILLTVLIDSRPRVQHAAKKPAAATEETVTADPAAAEPTALGDTFTGYAPNATPQPDANPADTAPAAAASAEPPASDTPAFIIPAFNTPAFNPQDIAPSAGGAEQPAQAAAPEKAAPELGAVSTPVSNTPAATNTPQQDLLSIISQQ